MGSRNLSHAADGPFETDILVVGGGPVGMFTALRLAQLGQSCAVVEKNTHTTIHPKMEYVSHRSMEIYRRIGLINYIRPLGVPESYGFGELFTTGLGGKNCIVARIDGATPEELRKLWAESNDGSHPLEPHMRQTQIIFEATLKQLVQEHSLVQDYWGYSFESLVENDDTVLSTICDPSANRIVIKSRYVIGCDGAGSKVRSSAGLLSPRRFTVSITPMNTAYVHFKSRDLEKMQSLGDFWHLTILTGAVVVAQDQVDTYTIHLPLGTDLEIGDPQKFVNELLGGVGEPFDINIDEVIVSGKWQANLSLADSFRSHRGRVFLAGDAAHQLTPAGGHGLNSVIQDSYDLAWKLVAVLGGWGGDGLLDSYNLERRPVAELNTRMVEKAVMEVIIPWTTKAKEVGLQNLVATTEYGQKCRDVVRDQILGGRWMHKQTGTIMGYRYNASPIVTPDPSTSEPPTSITEYIPSTWPGARAPHVFLSDGKTSIFDLYGPYYSIIDFTGAGNTSKLFGAMGNNLGIPVTEVHLPKEKHCRAIWERDVILVRPDGFVAWRCPPDGAKLVDETEIKRVLLTSAGRSSVV